ncbi:alpha/beta fold hydrolase [Acinetobacter piscicola]|uniref:alpha/beta fold hydrolase n=1 Tax=Acinetobacter piscicola TaxID=2006115 RepID=UPI0012FF66EF|nr:alpha/beta hydrolase [Acinetobacter piscicola]
MELFKTQKTIQLPCGAINLRENGKGYPVIFLHGIVTNSLVWRHVVAGLGSEVRCIVPDLPLGSHKSALPNTDLSIPGIAQIVVDLLDSLNIEHAVIVGNGYGGDIAQVIAAKYPERISGLVLIATNAFDSDPWTVKLLGKVAALLSHAKILQTFALKSKIVQRLPIAYGGVTKRAIPQEIMVDYLSPLQCDPLVYKDLLRFFEELSPSYLAEYSPMLAEYKKPSLLIWPREEKFFPAEGAVRLAKTLPHCSLEIVDDAYAWVPEDNPNALVRLLTEFLDAMKVMISSQEYSSSNL